MSLIIRTMLAFYKQSNRNDATNKFVKIWYVISLSWGGSKNLIKNFGFEYYSTLNTIQNLV